MVSVDMYKLGKTVDLGVKICGTYYRTKFHDIDELKQRMLDVRCDLEQLMSGTNVCVCIRAKG